MELETPTDNASQMTRGKLAAIATVTALAIGGLGYAIGSNGEDGGKKTEISVPSEPLIPTSNDVYLGQPGDGAVYSQEQFEDMFSLFSNHIEKAINTGDTRYYGLVFTPEARAQYDVLSCAALKNGGEWNHRFTAFDTVDSTAYTTDEDTYGQGVTFEAGDDIFKGDPTVEYPPQELSQTNFTLSVQKRPKKVTQEDGSIITENIWMIVQVGDSSFNPGIPTDCEY